MSKKRVALRLSDDEVAVVGTRDRWEHLISVYECFAADETYADTTEEWLAAAEWIRDALKAAEPKIAEEDDWQ